VKKEIVDKLIKFQYKTLHYQHKQHFETKWEAYRFNDMTHPIFEQRINRIKQQIDLDGLSRDFIYSMNLLSTRLGCKRCGRMTKISFKHYDRQHCQNIDLKITQAMSETLNMARQAWLIKKQIIGIRSQNKDKKLSEEQVVMIQELKTKKEEIKQELEEQWRKIYFNILTLI